MEITEVHKTVEFSLHMNGEEAMALLDAIHELRDSNSLAKLRGANFAVIAKLRVELLRGLKDGGE